MRSPTLTLASIMQLNGHLSPPLSFRKKVVDLSLSTWRG
jgi:hypothetical protein